MLSFLCKSHFLHQRKGKIPLMKPWKTTGVMREQGTVNLARAMGSSRRRTYCSWGSGCTASGPGTPGPCLCPSGAPARGLAPSLGPSPGPSPGHLRKQTFQELTTCPDTSALTSRAHTPLEGMLGDGSRTGVPSATRHPGPGPRTTVSGGLA